MPKTVTGAEYVITRAGGLTKTAKGVSQAMNVRVPVTTVQGWKERNRIPQDYWMTMIDLAEANDQPVTLADFLVDHEVPDDEPAQAMAEAS